MEKRENVASPTKEEKRVTSPPYIRKRTPGDLLRSAHAADHNWKKKHPRRALHRDIGSPLLLIFTPVDRPEIGRQIAPYAERMTGRIAQKPVDAADQSKHVKIADLQSRVKRECCVTCQRQGQSDPKPNQAKHVRCGSARQVVARLHIAVVDEHTCDSQRVTG